LRPFERIASPGELKSTRDSMPDLDSAQINSEHSNAREPPGEH